MTIKELQDINRIRAKRWHNNEEEPWTTQDWTNALAGEAGEACNKSKKLKRIKTHLPNREAGIVITDADKLKLEIAKECADTILYAILTIDHLGYDAQSIVKDVFNIKSIEYGFPERI